MSFERSCVKNWSGLLALYISLNILSPSTGSKIISRMFIPNGLFLDCQGKFSPPVLRRHAKQYTTYPSFLLHSPALGSPTSHLQRCSPMEQASWCTLRGRRNHQIRVPLPTSLRWNDQSPQQTLSVPAGARSLDVRDPTPRSSRLANLLLAP